MKTILFLAVMCITSCAGMGGITMGLTGTTKGIDWTVSAKVPEKSAKQVQSVTP